ncbi:transcription factor IIIA [Spea bombifrons]|uniref:transcription factor IIIA n=1 Tax=Spea bombifrons TaxID=233779 RepID=UPI0023494522|nr:transcription factor IIIA [Spea bombifrons]
MCLFIPSRTIKLHMAALMAPWVCQVGVGVSGAVDSALVMGETTVPPVYNKFICSFPDCNKSFNKDWKLQVHLCKHTGQKPFRCEYEGCDKGFATMYHLSRHTVTHTGEKNYKCESEECDLKFSTKANMKKHFNRVHMDHGQTYVCEFADCGKKFKKHNQLKVHMCVHTNELPFKCTFEGCDKSFCVPSRLKRHQKVHAGYPCKISTCEFVGKTWSDYLKHESSTHKEPSVCDVCNRKFKTKAYLKEHQVVHSEERKVYNCPREGCDRTYTTLFNLKSHILTFHEEQRPFVCEHAGCGKTFALKLSLERHGVVHDPAQKKKQKVRTRQRRSLASRLSGYKPSKNDLAALAPTVCDTEAAPENKPQESETTHALLDQLSLK